MTTITLANESAPIPAKQRKAWPTAAARPCDPQTAYRVLVADDQPDVLTALRLLLKSEGFQAVAASSPEGVVRALDEQDFDVVLMDLNYTRDTTSGKEGLDLLERLKRLDHAPPGDRDDRLGQHRARRRSHAPGSAGFRPQAMGKPASDRDPARTRRHAAGEPGRSANETASRGGPPTRSASPARCSVSCSLKKARLC